MHNPDRPDPIAAYAVAVQLAWGPACGLVALALPHPVTLACPRRELGVHARHPGPGAEVRTMTPDVARDLVSLEYAALMAISDLDYLRRDCLRLARGARGPFDAAKALRRLRASWKNGQVLAALDVPITEAVRLQEAAAEAAVADPTRRVRTAADVDRRRRRPYARDR